jgi:DNA-binding SARP family transcriptional activator
MATMAAVRGMSGDRDGRGAVSAAVRISLLGRLRVTVDGVDRTPRGPTQRRLIAVLALAAGRDTRLPLAELVDEVYRDELPPRPRRSLATLVWRLRKSWGARTIESDQYSYWLSPDRCVVDVAELEELLQRGNALAREGQPEAAVVLLAQALEMWGDPDTSEQLLPPAHAQRLTELHLGAMERQGELLAGLGRDAEAIELLEHVTAQRPDWEHSQALLIRSHHALGNQADAHRACDRARRALIDQGIEPGPELARAISGLMAAPAPVAAPARPVVHEPAAPAELVGRTAELEGLVRAAREALRARAATVLAVTGEAGIGKSTLVRAVVEKLAGAEATVAALALHCDPRRTLPYAVFAPMLASSDTETAAARLLRGESGPETSGGTDALLEELAARLRALAAPGGLVMVVEDVHWAPTATTDVLAALLQRAEDLPLAVLVTTRHRGLQDSLTPWIRRRTRLRGLGVDDVAAILGSEVGAERAAAMRRLTGGNPLYITQLHQLGTLEIEDQPDDLTAAIEAHLQILPPEVLDSLQVAAAVGDSFALATLVPLGDGLQRALPVWRDHLAVAIDHGLIRADPAGEGSYEFVHTLIREHLYRQLPAEQQTRIHAAIGSTLRRMGVSRPCPPDLLAHHSVRGWPVTTTCEVIEALTAAGHAAGAQLDFAQAADHFRRALDYLAMDARPEEDDRTPPLLAAAAGACAAAGDTQTANELYGSLLRVAQGSGLTRWRISAALGALRTTYTRRVGHEVTDNLAAAVAAACEDGTLSEAPDLAGAALAAIQVYRPARAVELLHAATAARPDLTGRLRMAIWEHQDVPDQVVTARRLVDDATVDPVAAWLRLWVSEVASGTRALDDAPPLTASINAADERTKFDLTQWRIAAAVGTGRLQHAHRMITEALAAPRHPDPAENAHRAASFYGQLAHLSLIADDVPAAQRSPTMKNPTWANRHPIMRYVRAYMRSLSGAREEARELCDELVEEIRDEVIPDSDIVPRLVLLGRAVALSGHAAGMEPCLERLSRHRGRHGIFRFGQYWGAVDGVIGRLQVAMGDLAGAIDSFRAGVTAAKAIHANLEVTWLQSCLSDALERRGSVRAQGSAAI